MAKSFLQTLSKEFKKSDQTLKEFLAEVKQLTAQDKQDLHAALVAEGITCEPPKVK